MKPMDFSVWLGERRRHSPSYDNNARREKTGFHVSLFLSCGTKL